MNKKFDESQKGEGIFVFGNEYFLSYLIYIQTAAICWTKRSNLITEFNGTCMIKTLPLKLWGEVGGGLSIWKL